MPSRSDSCAEPKKETAFYRRSIPPLEGDQSDIRPAQSVPAERSPARSPSNDVQNQREGALDARSLPFGAGFGTSLLGKFSLFLEPDALFQLCAPFVHGASAGVILAKSRRPRTGGLAKPPYLTAVWDFIAGSRARCSRR